MAQDPPAEELSAWEVLRRMSRPVWNLGDGLEQLSYAATSFSGQ